MRRRGDDPFVEQLIPQGRIKSRQNGIKIIHPKETIHLRHLSDKILFITLRKTTHHIKFPDFIPFPLSGPLKDGVDRFLFCIIDKTAGIDDNNIGRTIAVMQCFNSCSPELAHHHFGVNQIFRTAQCDDIGCFYAGKRGFQRNNNLNGDINNNSRKAVFRISMRSRHSILAEEGINKLLFDKWL
ncbi:hypothetical protein DSECCO2_566300 [anaerobic digester metagenome]